MPRLSRLGTATLVLLAMAACEETAEPGLKAPTAPSLEAGITTGHISPGGPTVGLRVVAQGLTSPVSLAEAPDGSHRIYIVDQIGVIRLINRQGRLVRQPFLDVRDKIVSLMPGYDERGLLGLAFHPQFAANGRFFIYYTAPPRLPGYDNTSTLAEYHVNPQDPEALPTFTGILLQEDHPQFNHDAGTLAFGPDGYLYLTIGDGGGGNDIGQATAEEWLAGNHQGHVPDWYTENGVHSAGGNGQDIQANLMGNVLRLDVSTPGTYTVPSDNPFVGKGKGEVWAYGFRNPYRFSFDMGGDHALYLGDSGQDLWEEIDVVTRGGNYGWNVKEGTHCFDAAESENVLPSCPSADPTTGVRFTDPIIELPNYENPFVGEDEGILVVIGGYVYRGSDVPQLRGRYVFGAFSTDELDEGPEGAILVAQPGNPERPGLRPVQMIRIAHSEDGELGHFVLGLGQDRSGEMYVLTTDNTGPAGETGKVFRITLP
jgi:glucose/arabinose dehydrogenase